MTDGRLAKVLILSAGVGQGHHAAAEGVREELARVAPDVCVVVHNGLGEAGGTLRLVLERFTRWQLMHWPRAYNCSYAMVVRWSVGRRLAQRVLYRTARKTLSRLIEAERPDVVVSTYPGITAPLGAMRERRQLRIPLCAVVTDFASLHFWAHRSADLHLASYPESLREISAITAGAPAAATRPPIAGAHWRRRERRAGRRALQLQPDRPLALISGGGWGVGDLRGAIEAALRIEGLQVIVVCGDNELATRRLRREYGNRSEVRVIGYSEQMAELLGAADVLVHSTGGMTCLEAAAHGCPVVAFGFAYGHVRHNVRAMVRHGLISHARDTHELTGALRRALARTEVVPLRADDRVATGAAILELMGVGGGERASRRDPGQPFARTRLGAGNPYAPADVAAGATVAAPTP